MKALNDRGITSVDLHEIVPDIFFWQDKNTKKKVVYTPVQSRDWFNTVERICDMDRLKKMLAQQPNIVMAGTVSSDQSEFVALFDKVILLQCDPETIIHRMKTRTNKSGYGKTPAEQEDNIEWQKEFDQTNLSLGAVSVNTSGDLNKTVDKIIGLI